MRRIGLGILVVFSWGLAGAGCVGTGGTGAGPVPGPDGETLAPMDGALMDGAPGMPGDPVVAMLSEPRWIECDRLILRIPGRLWGASDGVHPGIGAPALVRLGEWRILVREDAPDLEVGGEDLTMVAEGIVKFGRRNGRLFVEEGPFRTLVLRNERMMRR